MFFEQSKVIKCFCIDYYYPQSCNVMYYAHCFYTSTSFSQLQTLYYDSLMFTAPSIRCGRLGLHQNVKGFCVCPIALNK